MNESARAPLDRLPLRWAPPGRAWLPAAAALGIAGDTLLRATPGAGLAAWLAAVLVTAAALAAARGALGRDRTAVLGLGIAAAATVAIRSAPDLQVLAVGAVAVSIGWALLDRPWASGVAARVAAYAVAGLSAAGLAPLAAAVVSRREAGTRSSAARRGAVALRGALAAAPILLVVGALFAAGDPVFGRYADRLLEAGLERVISHLALGLALAWLAGGLVHAVAAVRVEDPALEPGPFGGFAGEALVALLLVDLLFAAFLGVQARVLFGGRAFVEATAGMTYAEYARSGFFQLAVASLIALPTALAAGWIVGPAPERRRAFVALATGLAAGVVLVLASAAHRMALYVDAYGLTEARLYASAFMAWLALTAAWLAATLVAGRSERFPAGALVAGWAVFLALVVVNPAGLVVRVNAARAAAGEGVGFDVRYGTAALGADAVPALVDAVGRIPAEDGCRVAARLLEDRAGLDGADPRSWTLSGWRARRAIHGAEPVLRRAAAGCPADEPEPDRPSRAPETIDPAYAALSLPF